MKLTLPFLTLAMLIGGCSAGTEVGSTSTDSLTGSEAGAPVSKALAMAQPSGIAGNTFDVRIESDLLLPRLNGDSPYGRAVTVSVAYHDKAGYFGNATSLTPYIGIETQIHNHRGENSTELENRPAGTGFKLALASGGTRTYEGRVQFNVTGSPGSTSAKLTGLLLAFKAAGAERWDSNTQNNYRVAVFGSLQPNSNDMTSQGVLTP